MRKILILAFFVANQAYAQRVEGVMDCTVTGNILVASEEGRYKHHSGIEGGVEANEKLRLSYTVSEDRFYMRLERQNPEAEIVFSSYLGIDDADVEGGPGGGFVMSRRESIETASFLTDYIRAREEGGEFMLHRYYKNDWHGIHVKVVPIAPYVLSTTLNCRHTTDNMDQAFSVFNDGKR
jgi:hypothetical protein